MIRSTPKCKGNWEKVRPEVGYEGGERSSTAVYMLEEAVQGIGCSHGGLEYWKTMGDLPMLQVSGGHDGTGQMHGDGGLFVDISHDSWMRPLYCMSRGSR